MLIVAPLQQQLNWCPCCGRQHYACLCCGWLGHYCCYCLYHNHHHHHYNHHPTRGLNSEFRGWLKVEKGKKNPAQKTNPLPPLKRGCPKGKQGLAELGANTNANNTWSNLFWIFVLLIFFFLMLNKEYVFV